MNRSQQPQSPSDSFSTSNDSFTPPPTAYPATTQRQDQVLGAVLIQLYSRYAPALNKARAQRGVGIDTGVGSNNSNADSFSQQRTRSGPTNAQFNRLMDQNTLNAVQKKFNAHSQPTDDWSDELRKNESHYGSGSGESSGQVIDFTAPSSYNESYPTFDDTNDSRSSTQSSAPSRPFSAAIDQSTAQQGLTTEDLAQLEPLRRLEQCIASQGMASSMQGLAASVVGYVIPSQLIKRYTSPQSIFQRRPSFRVITSIWLSMTAGSTMFTQRMRSGTTECANNLFTQENAQRYAVVREGFLLLQSRDSQHPLLQRMSQSSYNDNSRQLSSQRDFSSTGG